MSQPIIRQVYETTHSKNTYTAVYTYTIERPNEEPNEHAERSRPKTPTPHQL